MNKAILSGRLGKEVELRQTGSGTPVANVTMATNEWYTDKNGNRKKRTDWHRLVIWGKQAQNAQKFLKKGSMVQVTGRLQENRYVDNSGINRSQVELHVEPNGLEFLDRFSSQEKPVEQADAGDEPVSREDTNPNGNPYHPQPKSNGSVPQDDVDTLFTSA